VVRVVLTKSGDAKISLLAPAGLHELALLAPLLVDLAAYSGEAGNGAPPSGTAAGD
jgi:hypothetical protein